MSEPLGLIHRHTLLPSSLSGQITLSNNKRCHYFTILALCPWKNAEFYVDTARNGSICKRSIAFIVGIPIFPRAGLSKHKGRNRVMLFRTWPTNYIIILKRLPPKVRVKMKSKRRGAGPPKLRTEEERAELLRNDPRATQVEARRVLCGMCGLWIKLRNTTTYCPTPWFVHAERCQLRLVSFLLTMSLLELKLVTGLE